MVDSPSVGILAYDGVNALALVGLHDALVSAECDLDATTYSLVPSDTITADAGLGLVPDDVLIGTPDVVVVPGGHTDGADGPAPTYPDELPERLGQLADAGATVVGIGSGALALGEAGLLADRAATTGEPFREELAQYAETVPDQRVVEADDVMTATDPTATPDVTSLLVEKICAETNGEGS